jgi:hypothetical protein
MSERASDRLLDSERTRVSLSRALLIALVRDSPRTADDARITLTLWLRSRSESVNRFVFDLGWHESVDTAFAALRQLDWVRMNSECKYTATPKGWLVVQRHEADLRDALGTSLKSLQTIWSTDAFEVSESSRSRRHGNSHTEAIPAQALRKTHGRASKG